MKRYFGLLAVWVVAGFAMTAWSSQGEKAFHPSPEGLCMATFNLRYANPNSGHPWDERRPVMRQCIESMAPDIIGTQEGLYHQIKDLEADFPEYDWIGLGREGGSRGELMAIFYRHARLVPLDYDHFWLSDTPRVIGSTTWGHSNPRMVTWIKFRDRYTDKEFYFWNTHLDHAVAEARSKAAKLIRDRIEALDTSLPILLVGDFNAHAEASPPYTILVEEGGFSDTWRQADRRLSPAYATYNGYEPPLESDARIDWILSRGAVKTDATEIVTYSTSREYPSDHFPVVAWVRFQEGRQDR